MVSKEFANPIRGQRKHGLVSHMKVFGLYLKSNGKILKGFKQKV